MKRTIAGLMAVIALLGCAGNESDVETSGEVVGTPADVVAAPADGTATATSTEGSAPPDDPSESASGDGPEPADTTLDAPTVTLPPTEVPPLPTIEEILEMLPPPPEPPMPPIDEILETLPPLDEGEWVPSDEDDEAFEEFMSAYPALATIPRFDDLPHLFDLLPDDDAEGAVDFVNVKDCPSCGQRGTTRIEAPVFALESLGRVTRTDDEGVTWRDMRLGHNQIGSIEDDRLVVNTDAQVSVDDYPCADSGVHTGSVPLDRTDASTAAPGERPADHVAQMWQNSLQHSEEQECARMHIAFGSGGLSGGADLAGVVPEDVTVEAFGNWARVSLGALEGARFDAAIDTQFEFIAVATRHNSGDVVVDVFAFEPSTFAAQVLSNPARLLLDTTPLEGDATAGPHAWVVTDALSTIVVSELDAGQARLAHEVTPHTVRGYSNWDDATGLVTLTDRSGAPVTGTLSGDMVVNPGMGSEWEVATPGWAHGWDTFEFTLESVDAEPGTFWLTVSDHCNFDNPWGCRWLGVPVEVRNYG